MYITHGSLCFINWPEKVSGVTYPKINHKKFMCRKNVSVYRVQSVNYIQKNEFLAKLFMI